MGDDILDIHKYLINKNEEWDSIKCLDLFLKIFYSNGGGNFNTVNDPYAKLCLPNVVKNINVNAFNLMSRTNEARYIKWHETCKCKCKSDASVCNNKQKWNEDKCRCKCKELIEKGICDKGFVWNPSNCECDKSCNVGEYLDYFRLWKL